MDTNFLTDSTKDIPSLLLPIVDYQLLVPTVTVAEMIPYRQFEVNGDEGHWYLGELAWRGVMVPVVSFEALLGMTRSEIQITSQIAVFNNTGESKELPFFATMTQGIPRLSRITHQDIQQIKESEPSFCEMIVTLDGERALLPDFPAIEKHCSEHLGLKL